MCRRDRGFNQGEKEGQQVWIERKAAEIYAANPSWTMDRARAEEADVHQQAVVSSLVSGCWRGLVDAAWFGQAEGGEGLLDGRGQLGALAEGPGGAGEGAQMQALEFVA
jgi:hypothetical protein